VCNQKQRHCAFVLWFTMLDNTKQYDKTSTAATERTNNRYVNHLFYTCYLLIVVLTPLEYL